MNTGKQNTGHLDNAQNEQGMPQFTLTPSLLPTPISSPLLGNMSTPMGSEILVPALPATNSPLLVPVSYPSYASCPQSIQFNSPMAVPLPPLSYGGPTPMAYQSMTPMGYENIATPLSMFSPQWVGVSPSLPPNIPLGSLVDGNPYIQQDMHNPFYQQPPYNRNYYPERRARVSRSLREQQQRTLSGERMRLPPRQYSGERMRMPPRQYSGERTRMPSRQQYLDRRSRHRTSLLDMLDEENYRISSDSNLNGMTLVSCALDKRKSLVLQKRIAKATVRKDKESLQAMYHQFCPQTVRLCRDQYANFVLQRLTEALPKETIDDFAEHVMKDVYLLATDPYACRVLQIIIIRCSPEKRTALFEALFPEIDDLLLNNYGCYVLQKFVETMSCDSLKEFVEKSILPRVLGISVHQYSCRVMQDVLRYFKPENKAVVEEKVLQCIVELCKNVYGNYVAQKLVHYGSAEMRTKVVDALLDETVDLACCKSGSNILEKLLSKCSPEEKVRIMEPLIATPEVLKRVVSDKYGNYVIQRLCVCLPDKSRDQFRKVLNAHFEQLNNAVLNEYEAYVLQQLSQNGSPSSFRVVQRT